MRYWNRTSAHVRREAAIEAKKKLRKKIAGTIVLGAAGTFSGATIGYKRTKAQERHVKINEEPVAKKEIIEGTPVLRINDDEKYFSRLTPRYVRAKDEILTKYDQWLRDFLATNGIPRGFEVDYHETTLKTIPSAAKTMRFDYYNAITNHGAQVEKELNSLQAQARKKVELVKKFHGFKTDEQLVAYLEGKPLPTQADYAHNILHDATFGSAIITPILLWIGVKQGARKMRKAAAEYLSWKRKNPKVKALSIKWAKLPEQTIPLRQGNSNGNAGSGRKGPHEPHEKANGNSKKFVLLPPQKRIMAFHGKELGLNSAEIKELIHRAAQAGINPEDGLWQLEPLIQTIQAERKERVRNAPLVSESAHAMNWGQIPRISAHDMERVLIRLGFRESVGTGHKHFMHPDGRTTSVAIHGGKRIVSRENLQIILRLARVTPEQFMKALRKED